MSDPLDFGDLLSDNKKKKSNKWHAAWAALLLGKTLLLSVLLGCMLTGFLGYVAVLDPQPVSRQRSHKAEDLVICRPGLFVPEDLKDPEALIEKIQEGETPVAQYVQRRFSHRTRQMMRMSKRTDRPSRQLQRAVIQELNEIVQNDHLAEEEAFKSIALSEQAQSQMEPQLDTDSIIPNRVLLEEAFPNELERKFASPQAPASATSSQQTKTSVRPSKTLQSLKDDIVNIAPEIFDSVHVELADDNSLTKNLREINLDSVEIKTLEISVNVQWWEQLRSQEKQQILYDMFNRLKWQNLRISRYMTLAFDDKREPVTFDFGKYDLDRFVKYMNTAVFRRATGIEQ